MIYTKGDFYYEHNTCNIYTYNYQQHFIIEKQKQQCKKGGKT